MLFPHVVYELKNKQTLSVTETIVCSKINVMVAVSLSQVDKKLKDEPHRNYIINENFSDRGWIKLNMTNTFIVEDLCESELGLEKAESYFWVKGIEEKV